MVLFGHFYSPLSFLSSFSLSLGDGPIWTEILSQRAAKPITTTTTGGAMVLSKLPVPERPTLWVTVGQGLTALAVGASGVVWTFSLSSILSFLLPLFGRRSYID